MALVKDEEQHSQNLLKTKEKKSQSHTPSRSKSRSRHKKSKTNKKKHHKSSRSKSKSNSRSSRSKSRSRSRSRKHASSNHKRRQSSSRSKSSRSRSYSSESRSRSRSRSRSYDRYRNNKKRYPDTKDIHPPKGRVLGCFGLSPRTTEDDIKTVFSRYGEIENVILIIDRKTGISKGYAFIYFETVEQAEHAKESATGMELDGRRIRVDYSVTQRPHSPTPGRYYGSKTQRSFNGNSNYNGSNYNPDHERRNDRYGASSDRDMGPSSRRRKSRSDSRDRDRYSGDR